MRVAQDEVTHYAFAQRMIASSRPHRYRMRPKAGLSAEELPLRFSAAGWKRGIYFRIADLLGMYRQPFVEPGRWHIIGVLLA